MRKSRYTLVVDCHDGHEVLYSSINGALAVVEGGLDAILRDPDEEEIKQLIDDEFVVNDSTDDDRLRNDFLEDCFFGVGSLEMTILTTYDCNFACPYCFQETMHGPKYMSHTVAGSLLAWIERIADSTDLSHLGVGVTGGEPLLTAEVCLFLVESLRAVSDRKGTPWQFALVTNGSLLVPKMFDRLRSAGVKRFQIDVDGPRDHHDSYRVFKTGAPSFDLIMANISHLLEHDDVTLTMKIGITKGNADRLAEFLTEMESRGFARNNLIVALGPIRNNLVTDCYSQIGPQEIEILAAIPRQLGFRTVNLTRLPTACFAKRGTSYTVGPDGAFYTCPVLVNSPKWAIGSLPDMAYPKYTRGTAILPRKCMECEVLPICLGGCLYASEVEGAGGLGGWCRKHACEDKAKAILYERYLDGTLWTTASVEVADGHG